MKQTEIYEFDMKCRNRKSLSELKSLVDQLNRMDLSTVSYDYVRRKVAVLFEGLPLSTVSNKHLHLFRATRCEEPPEFVSRLGCPPSIKVKTFQRCNPPGVSVFYAATHPMVAISEVAPSLGESIFVSRWKFNSTHTFVTIPPNTGDEGENSRDDFVYEFLGTKFSAKVNGVFSYEYKITCAIVDFLSNHNFPYMDFNLMAPRIGGVRYPSVAHPSRRDCVAVTSELAKNDLELVYVEEFKVLGGDDDNFQFMRGDWGDRFTKGRIEWLGPNTRTDNPVLVNSEFATVPLFTDWTFYSPSGRIVDPGSPPIRVSKFI